MKRLLIFVKNTDIGHVINVHDSYYENSIRQHTKKYYMSGQKMMPGYFYMTKFNPDVEVFEEYFENPETITITIKRKDKLKLQQVLLLASGLDLIKGEDYIRIEDENNELVGLTFAPLKEEVVVALARGLNDETGLDEQTSEARDRRLLGSQRADVQDEQQGRCEEIHEGC